MLIAAFLTANQTKTGLSPEIDTIEEIGEIDRFQDVPNSGPFCDL